MKGSTITTMQLIRAAREERARWKKSLPEGLVMAILWAFIHYATTGETVEETFFGEKPVEPEYHI